jgi:hypothetical protein
VVELDGLDSAAIFKAQALVELGKRHGMAQFISPSDRFCPRGHASGSTTIRMVPEILK